MDYLILIKRKAWVLAAFTIVACALSVWFALNQKPQWVSTATLLPSESKSESPGLAGLAALAGLSMPQQSSSETFYPDIILSNDFLDTLSVIGWKTAKGGDRPLTLAQIYELKVDSGSPGWSDRFRQKMIEFIKKRKLVAFEREGTGLMTLTCTTIDPQLSCAMNTFLLNMLDNYNRVKKKTRTSEKKAIVEERLKEVEDALKISEERLKSFREKNISVSTPALLLEQQRLLREVEVNGALYQELRKQYEIAKIEVVDNTQFLNILEKPIVPSLPAKSTRRKVVMIGTMLGFFLGAAFVVARERWNAFKAGNGQVAVS